MRSQTSLAEHLSAFSLTGRSQIYELDLVDAGHGMQGFHECGVSRGLRRSKYDAWYTVGPTLVPRGFGCTLFFFPVPRRRCRKIQ
jgi:hypothetical protein